MSHYIVYDYHVLTHPDAVLDGRQLYLPVWCGGDNNVYEDVQTGRRARDWTGYWVGSFDQVLIEIIERHATSACGGCLRRTKERQTQPDALIRSWRKKLQNPLAVWDYHQHHLLPELVFSVPQGTELPALAQRLLAPFTPYNESSYAGGERTAWSFGLRDPENWIRAAQLRAYQGQCALSVSVSGPRV